MKLLDRLRKKIFNKLGIKTTEEKDEQERQLLPQISPEELKNSKYILGEIYIGGLAKNNNNKTINNLWEVNDSVEKYVILRRLPDSKWFIDIKTGEFYKLANTFVDNNTYCNIKYYTNDFKHKNYYVVETIDLISALDQEDFTRNSILTAEEIKLLCKNGWKFEFLKHDEKVNQLTK